MNDAYQWFRQAVIYSLLANAYRKIGDIAYSQFCAEWAVYFTAKGIEALALQSAKPA